MLSFVVRNPALLAALRRTSFLAPYKLVSTAEKYSRIPGKMRKKIATWGSETRSGVAGATPPTRPYHAMVDDKVRLIRSKFAAVVGSRILRYETAELLLDDGTWCDWPDLPIRIDTDASKLVSVAWSNFDDLWIADDLTLPFSVEDATVRWVEGSIARIGPVNGSTIRGVMLGRGEMTWDGTDVEIWTRLLIVLDSGWFEIFNALDENGYDFHDQRPTGQFIPCP